MFWERKKKEYQNRKNSPEIWLVAGLGNFGPEYENTRHNCGFRAMDVLAEKLGCKIDKGKFQGLYGQTVYGGKKLFLLKPQKELHWKKFPARMNPISESGNRSMMTDDRYMMEKSFMIK